MYIIIALINLNLVQSALASFSARYFSKQWNAVVKIEAISINPFHHVTLNKILVVDPKGDTILQAEKIKCTFSQFPINNGLLLNTVLLKNTDFNLAFTPEGLNLNFIIDYFSSNEPDTTSSSAFPIRVKSLCLENVNFSLNLGSDTIDLADTNGVNVDDMHFIGIYANLKNVAFINDSILATIVDFRTREKSGLIVEQISMDACVSSKGITAKNAIVKTSQSHLLFDASLKYDNWSSMSYYIDSVFMTLNLKNGSYGNMADAAYWAHSLWGMDEKVTIDGYFEGTVSNLRSNFFNMSFGNHSMLSAKASIKGLPDIENTLMVANVYLLATTIEAIESIKLPKKNTIKLPDFLKNAGNIFLNGDFEGSMQKFSAFANIKSSNIGNLHADLQMAFNSTIKDYVYSGNIRTGQLRFDRLFANNWIENIDLDINVVGSGTTLKNIDAKAEGKWSNFDLRKNNYDSLRFSVTALKGKFSGDLELNDNDINFLFSGIIDISDTENPKYNFTANLDEAHLANLNLFLEDDTNSTWGKRFIDSNSIFSAKLDANFEGKGIDQIDGSINLTDISLIEKNNTLNINNITLLSSNDNNNRYLSLNSDLFDFNINGYFQFEDFVHIVNKFMGDYFPQFFYTSSILKFSDYKYPQDFSFELTLKDLEPVSTMFFPTISISSQTKLSGKYNDLNGLLIELKSDSVFLSNTKIKHLLLSSKPENDFYQIHISVDSLHIANLVPINNIKVKTDVRNDLLSLNVNWNDNLEKSLNNGAINLTSNIQSFDIRTNLSNSHILINGVEWLIDPSNFLSYSETDITISNLIFKAEEQSISINSEISSDAADELTVEFNNFQLNQFNAILDENNLHTSGTLNGSFQLKDFFKTLYFKSDLLINDLVVNDEKLGDASLKASLDSKNQRININTNIIYTGNKGTSKPISLQGYIYPEREIDNYDLNVSFQNFKLKTIAGYLESFASEFEGNLTGNLKVKGAFASPKLKGELAINFGKMRINFLNTTYNFADKITVKENAFELKDFNLTDSFANKATINGSVLHNGFQNFQFDLGLKTDIFMFMNTEASYLSPYYGTIIAGGDAIVKGSLDDLSMDIDVKTEKGTNVNIPLSEKVQLSKNQFVKFVSKNKEDSIKETPKEELDLNLKININLHATPDAKISMPLSFSQMSGDLTASGSGDLRLTIDTRKEDFLMHGNYTIATGFFKLNLTDLFSRQFDLEKEGVISWAGNPTDATIDISGVRKLKASLAPLLSSTVSELDLYKRKINVESVINLKGKLMNPQIKFDIRLPHADQSTEELVFSVINKNNENQMFQQTVNLLLLSQFASVSGGNNDFLSASFESAMDAALGQASSLLNEIIPFIDIDANFRSGDQSGSPDQYSVNLSKDMGRFYINAGANFGVNNANSPQVRNNSNFVGEFVCGFRLTNNISLQGFNLPNTSDFSKDNTPYIQGIGVIYKQEFDRLSELFRKQKKNN